MRRGRCEGPVGLVLRDSGPLVRWFVSESCSGFSTGMVNFGGGDVVEKLVEFAF